MDLAKKGSPCKDIKPFSIFSILQDNVPCDLHELLEATCDNSELFKILTSSGKKRKARRNSDDDATERPRKREKVGKIAGEDPLQSHSDVTQGREKVKPRRSSRHHVSKRLML